MGILDFVVIGSCVMSLTASYFAVYYVGVGVGLSQRREDCKNHRKYRDRL